MANVIVTGLPRDVIMKKIINLLRKKFKKEGIKKFYIQDLSDVPGEDIKQMTINFNTGYDAHRALSVFNNFIYYFNEGQYPLMARIEANKMRRTHSPYNHKNNFKCSKYERCSRDRSRSPIFNREASKLDLEIEILRKQTLVIEEERRLLLERKKLDFIKEYGPSAINDFVSIEEPNSGRPERARPKIKKRQRSPSPENFQPKFLRQGSGDVLPEFVLPCQRLMNSMKRVLRKCATKRERKLVAKLYRNTLRRRIAVALENKDYMSTPAIVSLYRERYPIATDEILVKNILKNIRESVLPFDDRYKKQNKEEKTTNELNVSGPSADGDVQNKSVNVETKEDQAKVIEDQPPEKKVKMNENQTETNENKCKINDEVETNDKPDKKNENPEEKIENPEEKNKNPAMKNENRGEKNEKPAVKNEKPAETNENPSENNKNPDDKNKKPDEAVVKLDEANKNENKIEDSPNKTNEISSEKNEKADETNKNPNKNENLNKINENPDKTNENSNKTNENLAKTNENLDKINESLDKTNKNQVVMNVNQCKDEGTNTKNQDIVTSKLDFDVFEDGTDWNDDVDHSGVSTAK